MKLSDYVIRFLVEQGVKHVFMLPGGGAMHLNDSLGHCPDIQFVCNLHEQASAIAAEAYARVANRLGVALVTSGPGGTNAVTGVAAAWLDSTPCLFLAGQVKCADLKGDTGLRQLGVQEIDMVSIVRSITKYAVTVTDPQRIRYQLEKAVCLARAGRPGPAWVEIPLDVQAASIEPDGLPGLSATERDFLNLLPRGPVREPVAQAIEWLNAAQRPILLAGNGIRLAGAEAKFAALVQRLGIPVLTTRLGVDLIPGDNAWLVGMPGGIAPRGANFALQNSDWLLILGARLDMALIAYAPDRLARAAKKIMVNIDPAEIGKLGRTIDLPVAADAAAFLDEFFGQAGAVVPKDRSDWLARCRHWKQAYPFVTPEHRRQESGISTYAFSEILSGQLSASDVVLPGNSGFCAEIFLTALCVKAGQRVFHNKGTGAMGFSQPAALGACLAGGGRRTVCVDGDGGFQLNIQELETVKRLNLPIKFFVINNAGFASIRSSQQNYFRRLTAADAASGLSLPDLVRVGEAYGLHAVRLSNPRTLAEDVRAVLQRPGPSLCDVVVVPDEPREPRAATSQRADGSMVSRPLEDMYPFLAREEFLANMIVPPADDGG
jgi:acetolactate synthase-1/2/3 large subunit